MPVPTNEDLMSQVGPYAVYTRPIIPPITLPNISDEPTRCLTVNTQWMSYILGCAQTLARYETWWTDRNEAAELVQQAHSIPTFISDDCGIAPALCPYNWDFLGEIIESGDGSVIISNGGGLNGIYGYITLGETDTARVLLRGQDYVLPVSFVGGDCVIRAYTIDDSIAVWTYDVIRCTGLHDIDTTLNNTIEFGVGFERKSLDLTCSKGFYFTATPQSDYTCADI